MKARNCHSNILIFILVVFVQTSTFAQNTANVEFQHYCDGKPVILNQFIYKNATGTTYQVCQIQYFISNIAFRVNGKWLCDSTVTYIDVEKPLPIVTTTLPKKNCVVDSVRFTFGLPAEQNSYMPSKKDWAQMYWPEIMGGGYHYMKLNLKFLNGQDSVYLFNCHLGRSMETDAQQVLQGNITDNNFTLTIPCPFQLSAKTNPSTTIAIRMNVEKWFSQPNPLIFSNYTKGIMGKQEIMHAICENGERAFSIQTMHE